MTICSNHGYGEHIYFRCRVHPSKWVHTKNIDFVGARSIFSDTITGDCDCQGPSTLEHVCDYQAQLHESQRVVAAERLEAAKERVQYWEAEVSRLKKVT